MNTVTASIDVDALHHNFAVVRRHAPHSKIIAVLKANAYGHGLLQVANTLSQADAYGVARIEEALVLRANAITKPILVLGGFFSAEALPLLAAHDLQTPFIPGISWHCLSRPTCRHRSQSGSSLIRE